MSMLMSQCIIFMPLKLAKHLVMKKANKCKIYFIVINLKWEKLKIAEAKTNILRCLYI